MSRADDVFSSSESESPATKQVYDEIIYKKERPKKKPDRKGMTKAQLEVRMKNLEKARQARLANLQKKRSKANKKHYSDSDNDSSSSEELVLTKSKSRSNKKQDKSRLDRIEKMMEDLYNAKLNAKSHKPTKVIEKQIIQQVPTHGGRREDTAQMKDLIGTILF